SIDRVPSATRSHTTFLAVATSAWSASSPAMNSSTGSAGASSRTASAERMSLNSRVSLILTSLELEVTRTSGRPAMDLKSVDLVELAGHRGRLAEGATVDPVTAEVIRGAMETVCWEMAT